MTCACAFEKRELEIPADPARIRDAREWASRIAQEFGLGEDGCFCVKLAASEAVTNAIIHGSRSGGDSVRLAVRGDEDTLIFEVSDRGRENPGADSAGRLAEGGRGLELVSMVMDEVQLVRRVGGGLLRFSKRRGGAA
ncbi:MAG: ATP-binding protein [Thermoleophilaceae bacterium]